LDVACDGAALMASRGLRGNWDAWYETWVGLEEVLASRMAVTAS